MKCAALACGETFYSFRPGFGKHKRERVAINGDRYVPGRDQRFRALAKGAYLILS